MKKGVLVLIGILMMLMPVTAGAAACPDLVSLGGLTAKYDRAGFRPSRVAVDSAGTAYVAEETRGHLLVYDYSGALKRTVTMPGIATVGVDDQDNVYVGTSTDHGRYGEVSVYDSSLNLIMPLQRGGAATLSYPTDIKVDGDNIFVVDIRRHAVKVFSRQSGLFVRTIGGSGVGGGYFNYPSGLDINAAGELYVVDRMLIPTGAYQIVGASGHIYGADWKFKSKFGSFSLNPTTAAGYLYSPGGVALDGQGYVYVPEFTTSDVHIFTEAGAAVCKFNVGSYPYGLTVSPDGRLMVAANGKVFIYGLDNYIKLDVSPTSLSYQAEPCGAASEAQTVTVYNDGPGAMQWTAEAEEFWISISKTGGLIDGVGTDTLQVSVDAAGLGVGKHQGYVIVRAPGAQMKVAVSLTVLAPPTLSVGPSAFAFLVKGTDIPAAENLEVSLSGEGGGLGWTAVADGSWISVSPSSGPSGALTMAGVGISAAGLEGLDAGDYVGTVTVTAGCSEVQGSPATVEVALTYIKGGTLVVNSNTEYATYTISGPEERTGKGTETKFEGLKEGDYTVWFEPVQGFVAPREVAVQVVNGQESMASADYIDLRRDYEIIATMGGGQWYIPDEVRYFDESGGFGGGFTVGGAENNGNSKEGLATSAGDMDGDGAHDIAIGYDKGKLVVVTAAGAVAEVRPFDFESDMDVAVADLDGDGLAEIVVGSGGKSGMKSQVKAYGFVGGALVATGIDFIAYKGNKGITIGAGDLDFDGKAEIITAQGGSGKSTVELGKYGVDASAGMGAWVVQPIKAINVGTSYYGADIAIGDMNADGRAELVIATVPQPSAKSATITVYDADGYKQFAFTVDSDEGKGVEIAAGDMDMDGRAEIVVGEGTQSGSSSVIRVYGPDGVLKSEFKAFDDFDIYGVRVSLGEVKE